MGLRTSLTKATPISWQHHQPQPTPTYTSTQDCQRVLLPCLISTASDGANFFFLHSQIERQFTFSSFCCKIKLYLTNQVSSISYIIILSSSLIQEWILLRKWVSESSLVWGSAHLRLNGLPPVHSEGEEKPGETCPPSMALKIWNLGLWLCGRCFG